MKFKALFVASIACTLFSACSKKESTTTPVTIPEASGKAINSFTFQEVKSGRATVNIQEDSILISVPGSALLSSLTPVITYEGVSISPSVTQPIDFTNVVKFTVTASDSTKKDYYVKVTRRNTLFVGSKNLLVALDTKDGAQIWKYTGTAEFAYSAPALAGDTVFVGGAIDGNLYAFNARTGEIFYTKNISSTGVEGSPLVNGSTLYIGTNDDYLLSINKLNGNVKWRYRTYGNVSSKPVLYQNAVLFGNYGGELYRIDTLSGQYGWSLSLAGYIGSAVPVLHNSTIFFGTHDSIFHAVDAAAGKHLWTFKTGTGLPGGGVANGNVYVSGYSLYALDEVTGEVKWEALKDKGCYGSLTVDNGIVYVKAADNLLYAVDANTGVTKWTTQSYVNAAAAVVKDGMVYVVSGSGWVYGVRASDGQSLWGYQMGYTDNYNPTPAIGKVAEKHPITISL